MRGYASPCRRRRYDSDRSHQIGFKTYIYICVYIYICLHVEFLHIYIHIHSCLIQLNTKHSTPKTQHMLGERHERIVDYATPPPSQRRRFAVGPPTTSA